MSKSLTTIPVERVEQAILLIRGEKVILDADLAKLYRVSTKRLNEQVKRNRAISARFYVSTDDRGGPSTSFKITICDLETRPEYQVPGICVYRARDSDVIQHLKQREGRFS